MPFGVRASTLFFALLLGLAFGCKENPTACRQNLGGDQCCTDKSGRDNSFYCDDGHTTEYVGGDCNRVIFGIAAGRTVRCCEIQSEEDNKVVGVVVAAVVSVLVVVGIVAVVKRIKKNQAAWAAATTPGQGSPPPPIQQAVPMARPMEHAIAMPGMPLGAPLNVVAQPQAVVMAPVTPPVTPPQPPGGPMTGNKFDPITGQPIPKFDPLSGIQNWFDAPQPTGSKFDPHTGQPIPKFDPFTGVQNWFDHDDKVVA